MNYDFIEIGTSDFGETEQSLGGWGFAIDSVESIVENLPRKERVNKLCAAISSRNGRAKVYWVDAKDIADHNLPSWINGYNTIDSPHPKVLEALKEQRLSYLMNESYCEVMTWKSLVKKCEIENVDFLKLNTKTDDNLIVSSVLDYGAILPAKIQFKNSESPNIMETLQTFGYKIVESSEFIVIVQRGF
jgi:hypothetical protein